MANNTDWLNISQMTGGTGETALSLTALTNNSLEPKTATITARNTQYNVSDTTTVTIQGFQPTLTLSRSTLRFDSTGGTATFTVYSNTAWTINFPALVHSYSTSAGTGDTEVTVVLAQNLDEVGKVDTGTVQDIFGVNQLYLTIVQESFITELTVTPDDDIIFVNTGSSTSITIDTNTDWEIDYPAWITPSVVSGTSGTTTVILTAEPNGPEDRSNEITIYAGSKSVTINAFQPFYIPPYITVTPSSWEFRYIEDGRTFTVDSYPEWTAEIVSSGETVWTSDAYMEAVFDIPSAMTMPLWVGNNGSTTGVYLGPIIHYGSSVTFPSSGIYVIRYEMLDDGTTPVLQGNQYLKEITLSDKVGAIQSSAFTGCTALTSVTIGSGLSRLGAAAFSGCSSLDSITITAPTAPSICADTFYGVARGGTLLWPDDSDYNSWLSPAAYYLGYYDWDGFTGKSYMLVEYNVTSTTAPTRIFNSDGYASSTFKKITLENGEPIPFASTYTFSATGSQYLRFYAVRTDIPGSAGSTGCFENCSAIRSVELSDITVSLGAQCFRYCFYLNTVKGIERVKTIGYRCFDSCYRLTGAVLTNLTSIGEHSFDNCRGLKQVTIGDSLKRTEMYCFYGCTGLTDVVFGTGLTYIVGRSFQDCSSLTSITSYNTVAPGVDWNYWALDVGRNGILYYPAGSDYSIWLSTIGNCLGTLGWTGVEI